MDLVNEIKKEISRLQRALGFLESNSSPTATVAESRAEVAPKKRKMSASARRKISLAQKARWATSKVAVAASKPKRTMSAAGRKKIAAAQKARWAKVKTTKAA
jgi:hypothetical protein